MNAILKRLAGQLPLNAQTALKKAYFCRQIRSGQFRTDEPEYDLLPEWINAEDWVIDAGANVGHYTVAMARCAAHVMAFEPIGDTFKILSHNCAAASCHNVSLFNVALSSRAGIAKMSLPRLDTGLNNYYMASISSSGDIEVHTTALDLMLPEHVVSLIKIDVEGHEHDALCGMEKLLRRDKPRLIVEGASETVRLFLTDLGYSWKHLPGSPNRIFTSGS